MHRFRITDLCRQMLLQMPGDHGLTRQRPALKSHIICNPSMAMGTYSKATRLDTTICLWLSYPFIAPSRSEAVICRLWRTITQPLTGSRAPCSRHVRTYRLVTRSSELRASSNSSTMLSHGSAMKAPFSTPLPGAPAITSMRILTSRRRSSDTTCSMSLT
jgi:hypothetical protein